MEPDSSAAAGGDVDEIVAATEHPEAAAAAGAAGNAAAATGAAGTTNPPKPKVVSLKTEKAPDDYIQQLLKDPPRRLTLPLESYFEKHPRLRECTINTYRKNNKLVDVKEDILRQYHEKGYAVVGVERFDNGLKRLFILPEESTTVLPEESTPNLQLQ